MINLDGRRLAGPVRVVEVPDGPAPESLRRRRVGGQRGFQPRRELREAADGLLDPLRRRQVRLRQLHVLLRDV